MLHNHLLFDNSFSHAISLIWAKELDVRDSDVLCFRQWREFWAHNPRLQTPGLFICLLLHYYTLSFSSGVLSDRAPLPSWATCVHDTASLPPLDPNLPEAAPSWASTAQDVILIHIFLFGKKKRIPCTVLFRAPAVNDFGCLTLSAVHSHRHTHTVYLSLWSIMAHSVVLPEDQ